MAFPYTSNPDRPGLQFSCTIRTQKRATPTPIRGTVRDGMGRYGTVWEGMGVVWEVREGMGGYETVWGDLGAFEGGTGWYGTGFPRKFLNRPVASTSLNKEGKYFISFFDIFLKIRANIKKNKHTPALSIVGPADWQVPSSYGMEAGGGPAGEGFRLAPQPEHSECTNIRKRVRC